jgi:hypothetical protein
LGQVENGNGTRWDLHIADAASPSWWNYVANTCNVAARRSV